MEPLQLKYTSLPIATDKLKYHPMLLKLGLTDDKPLEDIITFFASEIKYHNSHYIRIPITPEGYILGNVEIWRAAIINKYPTIFALKVEGLDDGDILRFINTKSLFFRRSYKARWLLFRELKHYLGNTDKGKLWLEEISLKYHTNNINEALQIITGYSASSIKQIQKIGLYSDEHFLNLFDKIGYGEGQESLKSMGDKIQANDPILEQKIGSKFPISPEEKEKINLKKAKAEAYTRSCQEQVAKLMGNERLEFTFKWKLENKTFKGSAPPAHSFDPKLAIYTQSITPDFFIEIRITNIPELFKYIDNPGY